MDLRGALPSGAQEWSCPRRGRHFIVHWAPHYQRLVLAEGDSNAVHLGATGDVRLEGVDTGPGPSPEAERAWRSWLDEHGMTWGGDDQVA